MIALDLQPVAAGADGPQKKKKKKIKNLQPTPWHCKQGLIPARNGGAKLLRVCHLVGLGKAAQRCRPAAKSLARLQDWHKISAIWPRQVCLVTVQSTDALQWCQGRGVAQDLVKHLADETPALEIIRLGKRQHPSGAKGLHLRGRSLKIHPRTAKVATSHKSKDAACITSASPVHRRG